MHWRKEPRAIQPKEGGPGAACLIMNGLNCALLFPPKLEQTISCGAGSRPKY